MKSKIKIFFSFLLLTAFFPFLSYILPFIPEQILGFNLTGWAWIIMLFVTIVFIINNRNIKFPYFAWLPWIIYLIVYVIIDYSFTGLQLTLQYILPVLIGIVVSALPISISDLQWIFRWFMRLCITIYFLFVFGYLFRNGYTPSSSATPMILSIAISLLSALYYMTNSKRYLLYIILITLIPIIDVTRMGILVMIVIFICHFANEKKTSKVFYGLLGLLVFMIVFNTKNFQKKTFYNGNGKISDLSINYYDNVSVNNNGRTSWKKALDPGLIASPFLGNGPRADLMVLNTISDGKMNEAHNDYLSVRYNYGYVGLTILLFGFIVTFIHLFRLSKSHYNDDYVWMLSTSSLTLFLGFFLFMYSDNILKYTIFFPNLFFAMIGIIYSIKENENFGSHSII